MNPCRQERNRGLDLLRVILSFNVIILHLLHHGGLQTHADPSNPGYYVLWFWGIAVDCTVNCFALISGYNSYDRKIKYTSILRLHLTVVYHGLFITLLMKTVYPDTVTGANFLQALFPVCTNEFWYYTAFFALFCLKPLLIQGMQSLSKKQANIVIVSLLVVFSFLSGSAHTNTFSLNGGFSVLWLAVLFIIGTYLRKYRDSIKLSKVKLLLIYFGSVTFTLFGIVLSNVFPFIDGSKWIDYNSPTIAIAAIAVVLLFSSMSIPASLRKISSLFVPFVFSIYLIHDHPLVRRMFITDRIVPVLYMSPPLQVIAVLGIAILIWLTCFCLDYIRQRVVIMFHFEEILQRLEDRLVTSDGEPITPLE